MEKQTLPNLTKLLAPISKKFPTGKNIREDTALLKIYQTIKEARSTARMIERQQTLLEEKSAKAAWQTVYQLSLEVLAQQSKDLEVTCWLIEALLREAGFFGLNVGFKFLRNLCEKYWDYLYPLPDEDGIASRIAPLTGLNGEDVDGTLIIPIALVPLTENGPLAPYALWQYQQALELLKIVDSEKRAQRIAAGNISLDMIEAALTQSSANFLLKQRQALAGCITEYQQLMAFLAEKCGSDAPPCSRIINHLNACLECLHCIPATEKIAAPITDSALRNVETSEKNITDFCSREVALAALLQAADFFRRNEPHSPLPYVLERAVRWAKMPLPELLKEMVQDEMMREKISFLTGIKF
jgi:type VI secretion system protein ImpA